MSYSYRLLVVLIAVLGSRLHAQKDLQIVEHGVIPEPWSVKHKDGSFLIDPSTVIIAPKELTSEVKRLREYLVPATGFAFAVHLGPIKGPCIKLELDQNNAELKAEGYVLQVAPAGIRIKAATKAGIFYGIQTLRQLLKPEIVSATKVTTEWRVPYVWITDRPRFSWRAFMLDEARHFKGGQEVKKLLDQMASLKMNVFHWHLTDDQGWRIEIKKYPKLTSVGGHRLDTQVGGWGSAKRSGQPHSGFYSQAQIKDIVQYARDRHITIVPEIGMPGHACAAIAAYPQLGTTKKKIEVMTVFGKAADTYDPSSEVVYSMLSDILDEVVSLFPSKVIHIGGDEVRFEHWKKSPTVQKMMREKGLETMADVQLHFTNRVGKIVEAKGRNVMGWNEIVGDDLHGFLKDNQTAKAAKLDPNTVVHFWKGDLLLAKRAIKNGHTIVNSWHSMTYLDYGYGSIPVRKAYEFDPMIEGLTPEEQKRIVGSGCQMWGEWVPTVKRLEYQIYPRLAAYAEVGWTELKNKNYASFKKRMSGQIKRWDLQGIGYAKGQLDRISAHDFADWQNLDSWQPKSTPKDWGFVTFAANKMLTGPGDYEVVFLYQKGAHAIDLSEVSILEDGKAIATDRHDGFSGARLSRIVYKFSVKTANPQLTHTLRARIKGSGGTDSRGVVKFRKL